MAGKVMMIDPLRCTGCRECEKACSAKHEGMRESPRTRIQVITSDFHGGFYMPSACQQCTNPPCMAVCPKGAISLDPVLERVMIRQDLCVGCKMCVSACPIGAMGFDPNLGLAYKCDLCGGDPECVRVCEPGALSYVDPCDLQHPRMMESANKLHDVVRSQVV
jgi:carbon-monoxide dehydrogenase iron sulfur subunit